MNISTIKFMLLSLVSDGIKISPDIVDEITQINEEDTRFPHVNAPHPWPNRPEPEPDDDINIMY